MCCEDLSDAVGSHIVSIVVIIKSSEARVSCHVVKGGPRGQIFHQSGSKEVLWFSLTLCQTLITQPCMQCLDGGASGVIINLEVFSSSASSKSSSSSLKLYSTNAAWKVNCKMKCFCACAHVVCQACNP